MYGRAADPTGLRHLGHVLSLVVEGLAYAPLFQGLRITMGDLG